MRVRVLELLRRGLRGDPPSVFAEPRVSCDLSPGKSSGPGQGARKQPQSPPEYPFPRRLLPSAGQSLESAGEVSENICFHRF